MRANIRTLAETRSRRGLWWKRPLDVTLAGILVILLSPLMGLIALLIKMDSRGPVLFKQERVGVGARRFPLYKFRSMYTNSGEDAHREAAQAWFEGRPGPQGYKSDRDPRVTRIGRLIRGTSADELPQLFNVLRGEMSLVGPRPGIPYELDMYEPEYFDRLLVPPGMTGLWQVSGRDHRSAAEMMDLDLQYVRDCSLQLDLWILFMTFPTVVKSAWGRW